MPFSQTTTTMDSASRTKRTVNKRKTVEDVQDDVESAEAPKPKKGEQHHVRRREWLLKGTLSEESVYGDKEIRCYREDDRGSETQDCGTEGQTEENGRRARTCTQRGVQRCSWSSRSSSSRNGYARGRSLRGTYLFVCHSGLVSTLPRYSLLSNPLISCVWRVPQRIFVRF